MNKLFLLLFLVLSLSCSTDDQNRETEDCNCDTIVSASMFSLPNGYVWTVATLKNDCTGVQKQRDLVGNHIVGEKICN